MPALKTDLKTELRTQRLLLRAIDLADAQRVAQFTDDPDIARMISVMPNPNPVIAAEGYILIALARWTLGRDFNFAVELPGEGLIGMAGAHPAKGSVDIGYWIGKPYWGAGYASEAACAVADFAADLGIGPVTARHFADNPASGRVLEKAGFAYTGEVRPIFALTRGERAPSRFMVRRTPRCQEAA